MLYFVNFLHGLHDVILTSLFNEQHPKNTTILKTLPSMTSICQCNNLENVEGINPHQLNIET